jgi:phenylpyruvate tautomerase PptA (4-oxalocrotonate tautomerase family)
VPYLQLDLPLVVPPAIRVDIAEQLSQLYADVMETAPDIVSVAFRELGENGVLRPGADGLPRPAMRHSSRPPA